MSVWKNKVVVITGGSAGLGFHLATAFATQGATPVLVARDLSKLQLAADEIGKATGATVHSVATDVLSDTDVEQLVAETIARCGGVDVLVNCAGRSSRGSVIDTDVEEFQRLLKLNFLAVVRCTRAFLPHLRARRGQVINMGSLAAKCAPRYLGAYPASKFPVAAYSQQLRLELEGEVGVLLVCPGPVRRDDAGARYAATDVPDGAKQPGGGARLSGLDPAKLSTAILRAAAAGKRELVMPSKARVLFALAAAFPRWGDWLLTKMTK